MRGGGWVFCMNRTMKVLISKSRYLHDNSTKTAFTKEQTYFLDKFRFYVKSFLHFLRPLYSAYVYFKPPAFCCILCLRFSNSPRTKGRLLAYKTLTYWSLQWKTVLIPCEVGAESLCKLKKIQSFKTTVVSGIALRLLELYENVLSHNFFWFLLHSEIFMMK